MQTANGHFPPNLPVSAMKTFQINAPLATHWNIVTCADAGCEHHETGWDSLIDEQTELWPAPSSTSVAPRVGAPAHRGTAAGRPDAVRFRGWPEVLPGAPGSERPP